MKIAVDKNSLSVVNNKDDFVYLFDNERYEDLPNLHCLDYRYCDYVDINLTNYEIDCIKKAKITDKDFDKLPEKKDYKFAIIIPNCNNDRGDYNGKSFLRNCIESVLNQTYNNFELILIDDMSTDTSRQTMLEYMMKDNRIHIIENKRKRYNGGSRNVGIEYALDNIDFDYFCFLDSDDWWKNNKVLEEINKRLYNHEMAIIGAEMLFKDGVKYKTYNEWNNYEDFFMSIGHTTLWCVAWCRVIRKDKIVYFCEDTLMEDRVWSYRQADNLNYDKVINIKKIMYVWNRMNSNSVSVKRNDYWNASAYCHIGHQLQLLSQLKHKEMIPIIEKRVKECINRVNKRVYQQY